MGKKIRYQYLTGALLEPYFRFINKVEFGINPVSDPRGTKIARHLYQFANNTKPLFKGEKFKSSIAYDLSSSSSWAIFTYLNGTRQGYNFKHLNMPEFELQQQLIKKSVEFERVCQGFDDQYEDDVKK